MKTQALGWANKVWADFKKFTPGQKIVTIAAVGALIVGGILFTSWQVQPKYAPLYSNLSTTDASAIVNQLTEAGTPYQLAANGTQVLVPEDSVYQTRLDLADEGLPGGSTGGGYSLLDEEGIMTSEFRQQIDYQRAVEGELSKTIRTIGGVEGATVHLAIPKQDVFNDGSKRPTAAVMLTLAAGATIAPTQVQSVVYLVSSAVPELAAEDVTVADAAGRVLHAPGDDFGFGSSDARAQMTQDYNKRIAAELQEMIDRVAGPGHSVVTVNADLDFDQIETITQNYTYEPDTPPLVSNESAEEYTTDGTADGGILGTDETTPDLAAIDGGGEYSRSNRTVTNAVGSITQTVQNTPGAVKKLSVAVLLDENAPGVDIPAIDALVMSAASLDLDRGDTIAIQAMAFDTSAEDAARAAEEAAAAEAAAEAAAARTASLVKQGVIGGAILLALVITWLSARRRRADEPEPGPAEDDLLLTHQLPQGSLLPPAPAEEEPVQIKSVIPATIPPTSEASASRRALSALAEEEPDEVARVLSGWLSGS